MFAGRLMVRQFTVLRAVDGRALLPGSVLAGKSCGACRLARRTGRGDAGHLPCPVGGARRPRRSRGSPQTARSATSSRRSATSPESHRRRSAATSPAA